MSAMTTYIGTAVSRVDGKAKVTGEAKYAGEFNVPGLAYGAVVTSTIAKGKISAIDTSAALAVEGVLSVLTHEKRPPMADEDSAYKDDVAPEGSPFRPLYSDNVLFSHQPIALVLAEDWETARRLLNKRLGENCHRPVPRRWGGQGHNRQSRRLGGEDYRFRKTAVSRDSNGVESPPRAVAKPTGQQVQRGRGGAVWRRATSDRGLKTPP